MQRGIHDLVAAVRPTLGPRPRMVAVERALSGRAPEILDDAGTIARRILALPDRDADMGAMLARHLLWRVRERAGDGSATAAVIFEALFDEGLRYLTAGGNPMQFRHHLQRGAEIVAAAVTRQATPLEGQARLTQFAYSVCGDRELAEMLGEIFDIIGEYGRLEVRTGQGRHLEREYVEGMYWDSSPLHREMVLAGGLLRADLNEPAILISDLDINDVQQLVPVLAETAAAGSTSLLIVAAGLSDEAMSLLLANNAAGKLKSVAVKTPGVGLAMRSALEDLALLTGGRAFLAAAGDSLASFRPADLGRARRAWATQDFFGIIGGRGDPRALRRHVATLRTQHAAAVEAEAREALRKRLGQLLGGSATLWLGAPSETELAVRQALAERTAEALRGTILQGVVPGGGTALLACKPALQACLRAAADADERAAYRALLRAVEAPMRTIIANAGAPLGAVLAEVEAGGPGWGYDAEAGCACDMTAAGILDAARTVREAAASAITTAALALTTAVLVHRAKPPESYET